MTRTELDTCYSGEEKRKRCEFADQAADRAVYKMWKELGIDTEDKKQVEALRSSFKMGVNIQRTASRCLTTATVAIFLAVIWKVGEALWEAFKGSVGR